VVDGCTVFAGHGGFVVGSEMSGGVRNIMVRQCQFLGTDVGLRFKSTRGRGGIVENIFIDGISMTDIKTDALTFNMYYGGKSVAEVLADGDQPDTQTKMPVTEETPIFRNIDIRNVICSAAGRAMEFNGLPEMPIKGIKLRDITIRAKKDAEFTNCQNITKQNVNITITE
jgi:polygalacturonase